MIVNAISLKQVNTEQCFMKMKFNSDNNLPVNKIIKLYNMTIVIRSVFQKYDKYYPPVFQMDVCMMYEC